MKNSIFLKLLLEIVASLSKNIDWLLNLEFPKTNLPLLIFYEEKDKVVKAEGVKKIFKEWKGPKKIINNNTNLGGFNYHDIIGILNSPQDELFVEEINNYVFVTKKKT